MMQPTTPTGGAPSRGSQTGVRIYPKNLLLDSRRKLSEDSRPKLPEKILSENLAEDSCSKLRKSDFQENPKILVQNLRGSVCRKFCIAPPCKLSEKTSGGTSARPRQSATSFRRSKLRRGKNAIEE